VFKVLKLNYFIVNLHGMEESQKSIAPKMHHSVQTVYENHENAPLGPNPYYKTSKLICSAYVMAEFTFHVIAGDLKVKAA